MSTADLTCGEPRRRRLLRERRLNGVDSVEVTGTRLCVRFLTGIPPELSASGDPTFTPAARTAALAHIVIRGGRRVTGIRAVDVDIEPAANRHDNDCLAIELDREGDWSAYTLCFVETSRDQPTETPLRSLDPRYSRLEFRFRQECPAETDCRTTAACEPPDVAPPAISYLAKDYATFRQLLLDRLALTMPDWRERHVPDVGIAIVEVLAYVADYLSYFQDAVGTEQYLQTARQRISVRRHARLVDYIVHEGCNARVFLHLEAAADSDEVRSSDVTFTSGMPGVAAAVRRDAIGTMPAAVVVFEALEPARLKLRTAHNLIRLYTWGDEACCLARGATSATLLDEAEEHDRYDPSICEEPQPPVEGCDPKSPYQYEKRPEKSDVPPRILDLAVGDWLLFEELACAGTARNAVKDGDGGFDGRTPRPDADRTHRHVVRLTKVTPGCDALRGNRVIEVEWSREDALPFMLCISGIGAPPECDLVRSMAVARGNLVLADHGETQQDEPLPAVERDASPELCEGEDAVADALLTPARYRPRLEDAPLTFAAPLTSGASAAASLTQDPRAALPAVELLGIPAAGDGVRPLFPADVFHDLPALAQSLLHPDDERLTALRRRLRAGVRRQLDAGDTSGALLEDLDLNLRALGEVWTPRGDLLGSNRDDAAFVAEIDDDGAAHLRFGDGDCGRAVDVGMAFAATYRRGNGRSGLVGAESVRHIVWRRGFSDIVRAVRNPLPSAGGVDPEPTADVKMYAPGAFRNDLARAITAEDYAALAQLRRYPVRDQRIQSAAASLRWTGSWYEADVAVDPAATADLDTVLRGDVEARLQRSRRLGHDLRVGAARTVPLRLRLDLCIRREYLAAHVLAAVRAALGSTLLPGGRRGFFHPDNLTFGGAVYVSRVVAAVMAVEGVGEVEVTALERLEHGPGMNPDLANGFLALAPNEIARLDNDPAMPENGLLEFGRVRGGR